MMSSLSAPKAKANWTPAFHEIFVDSCLEQTLNGNKPGTHFTKEGWRNIVESFYKKTGLRYDKKQMKNHWDSTKEQWRVWCKLIKANGMKWDPVTCKFGANDEEWIKYTQENPEAAQFRFKELQHVNKLKTIFDGSVNTDDTELPTLHRGQNTCSTTSLLHAKESRTAKPDEWVDCSSDAVVVYTRRGRRPASEQSTSVSKESKPKASWLPALHETFIDICLQETLKGNRPGTHFTKEGWRNIVESFQEKTGLRYERIQLKNHWDSTKEQWKVWCKLISTSHMKWDSNTRRFGASEEDWENYIKYCFRQTLKQHNFDLRKSKALTNWKSSLMGQQILEMLILLVCVGGSMMALPHLKSKSQLSWRGKGGDLMIVLLPPSCI